jgi:hypothetical protein
MATESNAVTIGAEYTQWMEDELIPVLVTAFGKDADYWREVAKRAKKHIYMLVSSLHLATYHPRERY